MDATDTVMTSTIIDVTTTNKCRDLPPLNVYLRIRPFIGDEIERGENENSLNIIDNKHISIKISPTTTNTIRNIQTSYNEYEVTRIFDDCCTQQELFENILEQPTNEIFTGSNWLLCTLGLTNSGKTHTMFGTPKEPGLIPKCLGRIFLNIGENIDDKVIFKPDGLENLMPISDSNLDVEILTRNYIFKDDKTDSRRMRLPNLAKQLHSFQDLSIKDEHYSVWISFFELYNENILDLLVQPKDMKTRKNLRLMQNEHSTMIKNLIQIPVFDTKEAEDIIKFGFSNRSTSKTNLNEASSRSHAVICITLITLNEFHEEPTISHMYICDLAGNEPSMGTGKQLAETCNINTSLMTFKDCIRTLNEKQTSKKQLIVPYRNSVLTSIFRPFFVGRGRTIICCNINPCVTFVNQTNDLLKFCALAQKTIIIPNETKTNAGGLIRQKRKSKHKGPKRLVKDGPLKEKARKNFDGENIDEIQEIHMDNTEELSISHSKNTQSINYWKNCTKKALDLLQKQATNRRNFMIQSHQDRIETIQTLLFERQLNHQLINEKQTTLDKFEKLLMDFRQEQNNHLNTKQLYNDLIINEKQYRQKILKLEKELKEKSANSRDEIDSLKAQLKSLQQKFDLLKDEQSKMLERMEANKTSYVEREQNLQDEIQRLKRDLGLEVYRKQDAEKKARSLETKSHNEKTQLQKVQYDLTKSKHDLKTLQVKYDALQLELIEMHKNSKKTSHLMLKMNDAISSTRVQVEERRTRTKRRTNDEFQYEQEFKKPKRLNRSRSTASSNNASFNTCKDDEENDTKLSKRTTRNSSIKSTSNIVSIPIKQTKIRSSNINKNLSEPDVRSNTKVPILHDRTKRSNHEQSPSHIYATIERDISLDRTSFSTLAVSSTATQIIDSVHTTPKKTAFKRIQSLFRSSPTLSNSSRTNRVLQSKSTAIAFGSSTPTARLPPSKTFKDATPISATPGTSAIKKLPSPKGKYNLRTRLFTNSTTVDKDEDDNKTRIKKPLRTRK